MNINPMLLGLATGGMSAIPGLFGGHASPNGGGSMWNGIANSQQQPQRPPADVNPPQQMVNGQQSPNVALALALMRRGGNGGGMF